MGKSDMTRKRRHRSPSSEDAGGRYSKNVKVKQSRSKSRHSSKKRKRHRSPSSTSESSSSSDSSSDSSSSDSSSSSSESDYSSTKHRRKKSTKRKRRKSSKHKKKKSATSKHKSKKKKKKAAKLEKSVSLDKIDKTLPVSKNITSVLPIGPALPKGSNVSGKPVMKPMTEEQWKKQQSVLRHVYDPESGRTRLIRGEGEIVEEIVTKDRHRDINKQATAGDGTFYMRQSGLL